MLTNYIVFELELPTNSIDGKTTTVTLDYLFLNKLYTVQYKEPVSNNEISQIDKIIDEIFEGSPFTEPNPTHF